MPFDSLETGGQSAGIHDNSLTVFEVLIFSAIPCCPRSLKIVVSGPGVKIFAHP
jgi:hypothetical protein